MLRTTMPVLGGFLAVLMGATGAMGGEPADIQKQIDELKAKIEKLEAKKDPSSPSGEKKDSWADKVTLFGDFRYRHEDIEEPGREVDKPDRNRDRIRARLGLKAKVNEEVDLTVRLATSEGKQATDAGGADPASTNQTLGANFSKKPIWVDLAYFDYHPQMFKDADVPLNVLGGKMEVPFLRPGGSDLIWDGDLTPEGMAIRIAPKLGDVSELMVSLGGFWIAERHTSSATDNNEDAGVFGAQGAFKLKFDEKGKTYVLAGAGYFDYVNTETKPLFDYSTAAASSSFGNTKSGGGDYYKYDYNEVEGFIEVGFPVLDVPVTLYADYVHNPEAEEDDTGYMLGLNIGRLKDRGDWSLGYNYRRLEKDAVIGAFADSDSGGGGTNVKGHKVSGQVMLLKNVAVGATFFMDKVNISDADTTDRDATYRRLQLDFMVRF